MAAGIVSSERAQACVKHLGECEGCSAFFRNAMSDLNDPLDAAEEERLAGLESAQPQWQQRLVTQMMGMFLPQASRISWWRRGAVLAAAGGILGLMIVTYPSAAPVPVGEQTAQLLARAYGERRTLEYRMPGMPYAVMAEQGDESVTPATHSEPLLDAQALIHKQLAAYPSDPGWLQARGRANLIGGNYQAALDSLQIAAQLAPNSTEILIDLAIAYSAAGKLEVAYQSLNKALLLNPNDPLAHFNRAIVAAQLHLYDQAKEDAEQYLRLDSHSQWAGEMRELSGSVGIKMKQKPRG